jgi:hypothetical protein
MIRKSALTNLSRPAALFRFNEAKSKPGAVVEMIEQDNGLWTVTIVWDDEEKPVAAAELAAFVKSEPAPQAPTEALGQLSQQFESNGKPGAIGHDSTGGFSYGAYQIATKTGTMSRFLSFLASDHAEFAAALEAAGGATAAEQGDERFKAAWRDLAADPAFFDAQHDFIAATHYEPFAKKLRDGLGLDLAQRSAALRDVAWSVAVQHGPGNQVFVNALAGQDVAALSDRAIIEAVYAERSDVQKYFAMSKPQVKDALVARFDQELDLALQRLA